MEKNRIIIIVLVILIVVLAAVMAVMFMPSLNGQKDSKITITSDKTLKEGDNLTLKLTDLNKTPIKKAKLNVTITDKKGKVVVNKTLKTNSKGKAQMNLDLDKGKYTVNVTFGGNENYTASNTTQKLTIKEEEVQQQQQEVVQNSEPASESQSSESHSEYGSYINDEWVPMTEEQYAERYPATYHMRALESGEYDQYHPELYEVDRENGRI